MNKNIKFILLILISIFLSSTIYANSNINPNKVDIDIQNKTSLKKGARIFFDHCQGCHGLKYIRYIELADGIGLTETENETIINVIQKNFMHSLTHINENNTIQTSINREQGIKWFGKVPPDLSLIARYRGSDWLYTYLKSFYKDTSKPWGVNNIMFPDVGMPHVLLKMQGTQILKEHTSNNTYNAEDLLELIEEGVFSKEEYNNLVKDLVAFLSYVGEPVQTQRQYIGKFVMAFLLILTLSMYMLKREYWKNIK